MTLSIQYLYYLVGAVLALTAIATVTDRSNPKRVSSGLFWGLYALVFLVGDQLPPLWVGVGAVAMALIAGFGGVAGGQHKSPSVAEYAASAKRLGNKLFAPALAIPLVTMIGTLSAKHLSVGGVPSHTPLMREAANRLAEVMAGLHWQAPSLPVVQNVDANVHAGIDAIRDALVRQLYLPVRWTECVQLLASNGAARIAECGPGKVLAGLVKRIDKGLDVRAIGGVGDFQGALADWQA